MSSTPGDTTDSKRATRRLVVGLVAAKLLLHVGVNALGAYEFHRDEFLYFAMGRHLQLFRMDFPPLLAMLAEATRAVFGDSLVAIRMVPALAGAGVLGLAIVIARDLGGGRFAQILAGLSLFLPSLFLRTANLFQPVVLDQLWWTLALYALLRLGQSEQPRWWLAFGSACGLGILSKFSMLLFGLAALIALVITPRRRDLGTRWPWLAALLALLIGSPSLIGQINLGFPIFNQMGDLAGAQLSRVTPVDYLTGQLDWGPVAVLAAVGLATLLLADRYRPIRTVGWTCLVAWLLVLVLRGKSYYIGPIYPVVVAAAAVELERVGHRVWSPVARWGSLGAVVLHGALAFPLGVPVLPPARLESYLAALGFQGATTTNVGDTERIPQDYADMLGWEELVGEVARVYRDLGPADRERAVLFASNYGEAGAIDFYGPRYGLPRAVAFVGTYWFFGPGERPGEVTIAVGFQRDDLADRFAAVDSAGSYTHPYAVREQRDNLILICRDPVRTFQDIWPELEGRN